MNIINKISPKAKDFEKIEDLDGIIRLYCSPEYIQKTIEKFKDKGEEGLLFLEKFVAIIHPTNNEEMEAAKQALIIVQKLRKNQITSSSVQ